MEEIRNWKRREGFIKESVWLEEGIRIFRKLIDDNPKHIDYKAELASLLIRSGTDEKLKYVNLVKAKSLFEEVLELSPENTVALYRLGHISYEDKDYKMCMDYFMRATAHPLSDIQMFRAYTTMAKACFHIGDDGESKAYLEKAIERDKETNFTSEINEVRSLITQQGRLNRLVRYADGVIQFLSIDDAEQLQFETDEEAVLDLSHLQPSFSSYIDYSPLERKEAELLRYLIDRKSRIISAEELLTLWEEGEQPALGSIPPIISKLRRKVKHCLPENAVDIITNKRNVGYQWTCAFPVKIIKQL